MNARDRFRLLTFLGSLGPDDLSRVSEPTDLVEIAPLIDATDKAILFEAAGPDRQRLAANVTAGRRRLARAFEVDTNDILPEVLRRMARPVGLREVSRHEAPAQDVVETGDMIDLTKLPIHLQHELDGGLFISSAMDISMDDATGLSNVGIRRLMLHNRNQTGVGLFSPSDLKAIYERAASEGRHLPVAFVVGSHPIDHVAATMRSPVDEMELMASLRGARMDVVKCVTCDIRVPADAEYVLEGYLDRAGHRYPEGPFGEFLGYYGGVKLNPRFHVTAITRRADAVFQTSTIAGARMANTDTAQLNALRTEVVLWHALQHAVRGVRAVHATPSSGGMFNVRIALEQRVAGEARNAIAAAFGCLANAKNVFVVDDDIDIYSSDEMDWALATRFQPDSDLVVQGGFRAIPLDPSLDGARTGAKAGFDLTKRRTGRVGVEDVIPAVPTFAFPRFGSIDAALGDGEKTFEQLVAATGTRDGREIVMQLFELQRAGRAELAPSGKWRWIETTRAI